ncbi:MAG TPA: hypothetical protein VFG69_15925 [Nannocystaceae bacterium]|nr:hypothetical protein [Nannocystaceae bacterium]
MTASHIALAGVLLAAACGGEAAALDEPLTKSTRARLLWKRNVALEQDIVRALELEPDEVCNELGTASCTREVHHVALGGAAPFSLGLHKPLPTPMLSTAVVVDRVVLSACSNRVAKDVEGPAVVFTAIDLQDERAPAASDEAFAATVTALYRRFLVRDPTAPEIAAIGDLVEEPMTAQEFAILACYAVGSTTEFLFY